MNTFDIVSNYSHTIISPLSDNWHIKNITVPQWCCETDIPAFKAIFFFGVGTYYLLHFSKIGYQLIFSFCPDREDHI